MRILLGHLFDTVPIHIYLWPTSPEHQAQEQKSGTSLTIPVLALQYQLPVDGLPLLQDWISNASDIYHHGFEAAREAIEVRIMGSDTLPTLLDFGSLVPVKGLGKISILFFGIVYTYVKLRDTMTDEEQKDFQRRFHTWVMGVWKGRLWQTWKQDISKVMVWLKPSSLWYHGPYIILSKPISTLRPVSKTRGCSLPRVYTGFQNEWLSLVLHKTWGVSAISKGDGFNQTVAFTQTSLQVC